jgi:hypothetical protein
MRNMKLRNAETLNAKTDDWSGGLRNQCRSLSLQEHDMDASDSKGPVLKPRTLTVLSPSIKAMTTRDCAAEHHDFLITAQYADWRCELSFQNIIAVLFIQFVSLSLI